MSNETAKPVEGEVMEKAVDVMVWKPKDCPFTIIDLINEASEVDEVQTEANIGKSAFNQHLVQFAVACGSVAKFKSVCQQGEEYKKIGRAPKGLPKEVRLLYTNAPGAYKTAKSDIITSWEAGVIPGSKVTVIRKDNTGKERKEVVTLDTASSMKAHKKRLKDAETAQQFKAAAKQLGVDVSKDGGQTVISHAGKLHTGNLQLDTLIMVIADKAGSCSKPDELIKKLKALADWVGKNQVQPQDKAKDTDDAKPTPKAAAK